MNYGPEPSDGLLASFVLKRSDENEPHSNLKKVAEIVYLWDSRGGENKLTNMSSSAVMCLIFDVF